MNTEDKTMEQLLAEIETLKLKAIKSEKLNESIIETAIDGIISIDADGTILSWNLAAKTIFGYNACEILGKNIVEILPFNNINSDNKIDLDRFVNIGLTRKHGQTIEVLAQKKDGTEFPVELSISKWELENNIYYTGIFRDVTERRQKDFLLQKLHSAIKNSSEIILMTDPEGIITFVNPQFTKMYGYEPHEVIGIHTPRVLKATENKERFELLWKTILNKKSIELSHYQNRKKDGSLLDVESFIDPILNSKGEIIGFLGIQHVITERITYVSKLEAALEKAKESDRLKSEFLATMSHELRTPLNSIIGLSSLIDKDTEIDDIIEYTKIINDSGENLLKLIEDLFDMSLIQSNQVKVVKKYIDLHVFLNEIHDLMKIHQERTSKNHLDFNLFIPSNYKTVVLKVDVLKLKHILLNLLKNAFKFTEKGFINYGFTLCEKDDKTNIKFYITDTGIGINKNQQDIIFESFRQIDGSFNRKYEGVGIGLTITKKLIDILKGRIWVESMEGQGSTFYFLLPVEDIKSIVVDECTTQQNL